jgi:putative DNA primase/helicase
MTASPDDKGILVSPVPLDAPPVPQDYPYHDTAGWQYFKCDHYSAFKDASGALLRYVCRVEHGPDGKKMTPPLTLWQHTDRLQWHFRGSPQPRTFWNLDRIMRCPNDLVILVEGELKAEHLQTVLDSRTDNHITVITAQGGTNANKTTDWKPLVSRQILCWPDNDEPGREYMNLVTGILQTQACKVMHLRTPDRPENWDCKDAILIDKWDRNQIITFINANKYPAPDLSYAEGDLISDAEEDSEYSPSAPPTSTAPFRCLGFQSGVYFVLPDAARQVLPISGGSLPGYLLSIAPLNWYELNFPGKKSPDFRAAQDYVIRGCEAAGPYNPEALRGVGAWTEDAHVVLHIGDKLVVDGAETEFKEHITPYIYETCHPLKDAILNPPLALAEAHQLLDFLTALSWDSKLAAYYVAGWTVLAPVCGALDWRPNIWITGGSGTGKTSVIKHIMKPCVFPFCINATGGTTSAGIRNKLRCSALSIISDEAEAEDPHAQQTVQSILELARVASSGDDTILKGSQDQKGIEFLIRSMFCLSSIGVGADKQADKTRFTVCQLRHGGITKADWNEYLKKIHETITTEWAARLRARTVAMLPTIKKNAETFSLAISEMVSSSRAGDQHGTLLAGCFSLTSDKLITFEAAREWVIAKDWAEVKEAHDSADEKACCDTIMQSTIRLRGGDISISELILEVGKALPDENVADARDALARNGIKIEGLSMDDYKILIADSHPMIKNILGHTAWWKTYGRTLKRIVGSEPRGASKYHGICCRSTAIPWLSIFGEGD